MAVAAFSHSDDGIDGISAELIAGDPIAREVELARLADPEGLAELNPFSRRRLEASCSASARALGTMLPAVQADQWIAKRNASRALRTAGDVGMPRRWLQSPVPAARASGPLHATANR